MRLLTLTSLLVGCTSSSSSDTGAVDPADTESTQAVDTTYAADGFASCSGGASTAEIADNILITAEHAASLHELVACGGLMWRLCYGITTGIIEAILAAQAHAMPDGWTFDGDGGYEMSSEDASMSMSFFTGQDYEFAASGERITTNIFLVDSYLTSPSVDIDWYTGATELSFDGTGPLIELLGFGPSPSSPMSLSLDDLETVASALGTLDFDSTVRVEDERAYGTIGFDVETSLLAVADFLSGGSLGYDLIQADGEREELGQSLIVDTWGIDFAGDSSIGALQGVSTYRVEGGYFDYQGEVRFDNSKVGEVSLSCP